MLALDVKTVHIAGTITHNGQVPVLKAGCTNTTVEATVHLADKNRGYTFAVPVLCNAAAASFDATVFPGNYAVTVTGDDTLSDLPNPPFPFAPLNVTGDMTGIALDVKTVNVDGTITLNGSAPNPGLTCNTSADILFKGDKGDFDISAPCASPLPFSGSIYAGTYEVRVDGVNDLTVSGNGAYLALPSMSFTTDTHGLALDVKTYALSGKLTINGSDLSMTDCTDTANASFDLDETGAGSYSLTGFSLACDGSNHMSFTSRVYPGTYQGRINGQGGLLSFGTTWDADATFSVTQDTSNQILNIVSPQPMPTLFSVAGAVTFNGHTPAASGGCTSMGHVVFTNNATHSQAADFVIPCGADTSFSVMVPGGTYEVTINDSSLGSELLRPPYTAASALVVSANLTGLMYDEKAVAVSGKVTLNGMDPATVGACTNGSSVEGNVLFGDTDNKEGYAFSIPIPCSVGSFNWNGSVYPAHYRVRVDGQGGTSNLPNQAFVAIAALDATAAQANLSLDVKTLNVAGKVTLNAATPSTSTNCNTNPNSAKANVTFNDTSDGYTFTLPVLCSSADFSWTGVVFPGVYQVTVDGPGGFSSLPKNADLVVPQLKLP
jgi:hypothetical protein